MGARNLLSKEGERGHANPPAHRDFRIYIDQVTSIYFQCMTDALLTQFSRRQELFIKLKFTSRQRCPQGKRLL